MEHGTRSMYNHHRCRCGKCRAANRAYMRDLMLRLVEAGPPPGSHGKISTYTNWSCRCEPCRAAKSVANAAAHARRKAAS